MKNIKISCLRDQNNKFYFIFEIDKKVLKDLKIQSTDKLIVMTNKRTDRFYILKSDNGHILKKGKKNTYTVNFYDKHNINYKEFVDRNCNYFIKKNMVVILLNDNEIEIEI